MPPADQLANSWWAGCQWGIECYVAAREPRYGSGILGRNAALRREALRDAGDLAVDLPSGTDYHLAKCLLAAGYRIRRVPASRVITPYAGTWGGYARQQRRWLRNVALLGARFGAWDEARRSFTTSLLGLAMLIAPVAGLCLHRLALALWALALTASVLSKRRCLSFTEMVYGRGLPGWPQIVRFTLGDFAAWALPLLDYAVPQRRGRW